MKTKPEQFLFIVFLVISSISFGQAWDFHYDSISCMGRQLIITKDSNILATGVNDEMENHCLTLKLDIEGNILWKSSYGGFAVTQTFDNKFVFAGMHYPYGVIKKIDEEGELEWSRLYGGGKQEEYTAIIESSDTSILVCGYSHNHGDSTFYVMKTDRDGDVLWSRSFYSMDHNGFTDLIEFDHHYYVIGRDYAEEYPPFYLIIVKLTMSGVPRWQKIYEMGRMWQAIAVTQDSTMLITGSNLLIKINTDGDTIWTKELYPTWNFRSIAITPGNGYILSGFKDYPDPVNMLVEYDEEGNRLWVKYYPTISDPYWGSFESVKCSEEGGFVACGYSLYTNETITRLRVIKTDATGNIIVGTDEERGTRQTVIYPNPASRQLTFGQLGSWTVGQSAVNYSIYDLFGREIKDLGKISSFPYHIDITELPDGVYILRCTDEKGIYFSLKFLKIAE
jgi:hypothetical protein